MNFALPAVVFVHGILGFARLGVPGVGVSYFRGLAAALAGLGSPLYFPALPPTATVAARAGALWRRSARRIAALRSRAI